MSAGAQKTVQLEALDKSVLANADIEEMRETLPLDYLMIAPLSHASFVRTHI